jgi:hypothetical protein
MSKMAITRIIRSDNVQYDLGNFFFFLESVYEQNKCYVMSEIISALHRRAVARPP